MSNSVLFWNAQSLSDNLSQFKVLLYSTKPAIAFVSETWFKQFHCPNFINYKQIRQDRLQRRGGGILFLLRLDVVYEPISLIHFVNGNLEILAIKCIINGLNCSMAGIYNPQSQLLTTAELLHYYTVYTASSCS
jgi:hypothetical protein